MLIKRADEMSVCVVCVVCVCVCVGGGGGWFGISDRDIIAEQGERCTAWIQGGCWGCSFSPWHWWTVVFQTRAGPCYHKTMGEMLGCRLGVQVPVSPLGAWFSVTGLISSRTSDLLGRVSPGWKCQGRAKGTTRRMQPHLDEPQGTYASYQHPYTCTVTTIGGHRGVSVWGQLGDGRGRKKAVDPHWCVKLGCKMEQVCFSTENTDLTVWGLSSQCASACICCWAELFYSPWRCCLIRHRASSPPPISGPIFCSVCLFCWSWPQKREGAETGHRFWDGGWKLWWISVIKQAHHCCCLFAL